IGYTWANELTTGVSDQLAANARNFLFLMGGCFLLTFAMLLLFARRTMRDMDVIIRGVLAMRSDFGKRITGVQGELGRVADSINEMAEDVNRANEETKRAVFVLQQVMNKLDATVYVSDQETHTLVYVNEYLRKTLGDEELVGKPCYEALYGSSQPCESCPQKYLVDEKGKPSLSPYRSEVYNPSTGRNFLITARLVPWHDGRMHYMEVGTDVTDRKALAVAEAANLAQRDFLARMSHEIRTPMNGVLGMTRLAIQASPPPEQLVYLKKIQSSASLLLGIINDILDFSKIEAGKLTIEDHVFSPRESVENIRELILPRAQENNLELVVELDDSVPAYINADGLRLSQILLNLMGNATKFTLQGSVTLRMRLVAQEDRLPRLECSVTDTGIGMTPAEVQGLFRPFTQADGSTSRKFGGTGLGLSISKALVELMGGEITVGSQQGEGSTFAFYIPVSVVDEQADEILPHDQPWRDTTFEGCRLLLVEDNEINREIAQACFEELGAKVDVAENGQKGLEAFLDTDFDLIFMDVRMPVMDGLEATRQIRASDKHDAKTVPIVAMTANAMKEDREASQQAGMDAHIAKPFEMLEIKRVLYIYFKGPQEEKNSTGQ
ncbi:response regulator, partial [Desulfovibrio sp. OttesenSCG-928-G15]|nr:response regulator [Desulfovibrio sp. OttesenSCG-928-G15]